MTYPRHIFHRFETGGDPANWTLNQRQAYWAARGGVQTCGVRYTLGGLAHECALDKGDGHPEHKSRVRLLSTTDEFTHLREGDEGDLFLIDDAGTWHVRWDSGSTLGLCPDADEWEVVE